MHIQLPEKVRRIIQTLETHGFEGYAVGGCVRDSLLGRFPSDWDITTSASPEQVKEIFSHTVDTGIAHGTVTVLLGGEGFEVTTYRIDGAYLDARHPSRVDFTDNLREDLRRRDFTINAMAYNDSKGLVDLFDGMGDIERRVIRCVGDPSERFTEDALRILRAVRFAAQLDFTVDDETARCASELAPALKKISAERIRVELEKLITSDHPQLLELAWKLGLTAQFLPEFDAAMDQPQNSSHHIYNVGIHTLMTMAAILPERHLRLTMLLHDLGKPEVVYVKEDGIYHFHGHAANSAVMAGRILRRLKTDSNTIRKVCRLIAVHSLYPEETPEGVRRAVHQIGEDLFPDFLLVKRADTLGQSPAVHAVKLAYLERISRLYREIVERGDCLSLRGLAVSGSDLILDGMKRGKQVGEVLEALLDDVLADPEHNEKEYLMEQSRLIRSRRQIDSAGG